MDFYLDERQRKKRRRRLKLKIYGGLILLFLLIIGAGYTIIYSPLFHITRIDTDLNTDSHGFNPQIDNQYKSTLIDNLKIFFTSQSKIASFLGANNILIWDSKKLDQFKKNPEIEKLTIEKDYFKRQIKIAVQEREGFGVWCQLESCFWFDKNGVLFAETPQVEGSLIKKVDDFSGRSLKLGDSALDEKFISNLVKIFDVLDKSGLGIKSLKFEKPEFQEISTNSSPVIYFSLRIDPNFTLAAIQNLKAAGFNKIEYIDLRVENRAYYKPR